MKLTRRYSFFIVFLFPLLVLSQNNRIDYMIPWNEARPLTWYDFKGPADKKSHFYASTCAGIYYHLKQSPTGEIIIKIEAYFDPAKSWHKKKYSDKKMLEHEQRHFDIKEIYTRYLAKNILEIDVSSEKDIIKRIQKLYLQAIDEMNDLDDRYDLETGHSTNLEQQRNWNARIKNLLLKTKAWDRKEIYLRQ